jgi:hypothetical protein
MTNFTPQASSPPLYVSDSMSSATHLGNEEGIHVSIEKAMESIETFARREPWTFAAWVFGVGFVLGWKLKPW